MWLKTLNILTLILVNCPALQPVSWKGIFLSEPGKLFIPRIPGGVNPQTSTLNNKKHEISISLQIFLDKENLGGRWERIILWILHSETLALILPPLVLYLLHLCRLEAPFCFVLFAFNVKTELFRASSWSLATGTEPWAVPDYESQMPLLDIWLL